MGFTLKQLRNVAALCHVTQSALSQQVKLVEDACGVPLFDRRGGGVNVTPFGREFLARAATVLDAADLLDGFAVDHGGRPQRPINFGIIPTVAPYILADIYPALTAEHPDVDISVREIRTTQIETQLMDGSLDLGLIATDISHEPQLTGLPLASDRFVLAAPCESEFAPHMRIADLPRERLLLLDEGHCLRDQAMEACAIQGAEAHRTVAATSLSTIVEFVANGQGVTLLPSISLKKEAADARIRIVELEPPAASRTLSLVWHRASPFTKLFEGFAAIIKERVLVKGGAAPLSP